MSEITTPIPGHPSPYTGGQIDAILKKLEDILAGAPEKITLKQLSEDIKANAAAISGIEPKLDSKVSKKGDIIEGTLFITDELIVPEINALGENSFSKVEDINDANKFADYLKGNVELFEIKNETRAVYVRAEAYKKDTTYYKKLDTTVPLKIDTLDLGTAFGKNGTTKIQNNKVYGAVWNDYAEYRYSDELEPGRVIIECGDGRLKRASSRLQPGAEVVSDTFGFAIGQDENCCTPVAIAGRVLAYPNEKLCKYKPGDPVCSGPNGTVSKMTRREVRKYPDRVIGTVSEIPTYDTWGEHNIPVNGRIWIRIR